MPAYSMQYTKRDVIIKNYLEAASDMPISNMLEIIIEYHAKTGSYLDLGTVGRSDEHPDKTRINLYLRNGGYAAGYVEEMKSKGVKWKDIVRDVIINGITLGEKTDHISNEAYAIAQKMAISGCNDAVTCKETGNQKSAITYGAGIDQKAGVPEPGSSSMEQPVLSAGSEPVKGNMEQQEDGRSSTPTMAESETPKREKKRMSFADQFIETF